MKKITKIEATQIAMMLVTAVAVGTNRQRPYLLGLHENLFTQCFVSANRFACTLK